MSNYKDFLIGASGGGAYVAPYEETWTTVASASGWLRGSQYSSMSSPAYQSFHRLATKGLYGGLFDPYQQSNANGGVVARAFSVNQSNGSITVHSPNVIWNAHYSDTLSTGHPGAVGHTAMYMGHSKNPSYGSTTKGWIWGAEFTSAGTVENYGNSGAPINMWPHSNDGLVMATNATKDGSVYGRRSSYNSNDSKYWHSQGYFNNGTVSYNDYSNPSSSTSTNYAHSYASQSYDDLTPNGYVGWQQSGTGIFTPLYGSNNARASDLDYATYYGDSSVPSTVVGFHLSNGNYLTINKSTNKWLLLNSNGGTVAGSWGNDTAPANIAALALCNHHGVQGKMCIPLGNDTWLMPTLELGGFMKISIDVNSNYAVSIIQQYGTILSGMGAAPDWAGKTYDVTGSSNQFFVYASVANGQYQIQVFDNPYTA